MRQRPVSNLSNLPYWTYFAAKNAKSALQIWYFQKKVVYLQPKVQRRGIEGGKCPLSEGQNLTQTPQSWLSRHIRKAFIALCSDVFETSQLSKASSELSDDRCPTGYRLSLLCQFGYIFCVYVYAHTRTLKKTNTAQENIYIRRGLQRCRFKDAGNAKASKTWNDNSRAPRFFYILYRQIQ